jgi:hypothetical protein
MARTLQWASKDPFESQPFETFAKSQSGILAKLCEREVGKSGVLARQAPGGFTAPSQIDHWKLVLHKIMSVAGHSSTDVVQQSSEKPRKFPRNRSFQKSWAKSAPLEPHFFDIRHSLLLRSTRPSQNATDSVTGD